MRYCTFWKDPEAKSIFDEEFYFSDTYDEVTRVVANLKARGVKHYNTYPVGDKITDLSVVY